MKDFVADRERGQVQLQSVLGFRRCYCKKAKRIYLPLAPMPIVIVVATMDYR